MLTEKHGLLAQRQHICFFSLCPQVPVSHVHGPRWIFAYPLGWVPLQEPWTKRTRVLFAGLLVRCLPSSLERLSPSSRAACYTNILEKIGQNKGQIMSHSQDVRNMREPCRIISQWGWHCLTQCLVPWVLNKHLLNMYTHTWSHVLNTWSQSILKYPCFQQQIKNHFLLLETHE